MPRQLDIFGDPPQPSRPPTVFVEVKAYTRARRNDPATSHAAAAAVKDLAASHRKRIVACLRQHGPLGKDGIARRCRISGVAVARRTVELQRAGDITLTGRTVQSKAGRDEREWQVIA